MTEQSDTLIENNSHFYIVYFRPPLGEKMMIKKEIIVMKKEIIVIEKEKIVMKKEKKAMKKKW